MLTETLWIDEFGLVDDPIHLPVSPDEVEEGRERPAFTVERVEGLRQDRRHMIAHLR